MFSKIANILTPKDFNHISTNIDYIDNLIGGGIPTGRITEIVGDTEVGKTNMIFDIIQRYNNTDTIVCYISTSIKSLPYLKERGLSSSPNLLLAVNNRQSFITIFIQNIIKQVDLIILDCVPDVLTKNEEEGFDLSVQQDVPKLMQELSTIVHGEDCAFIAVNHLINKDDRLKPRWDNVFSRYASLRLLVNEYNSDKIDVKIISHKIRPDLVKE